jgi:hypothetical protein
VVRKHVLVAGRRLGFGVWGLGFGFWGLGLRLALQLTLRAPADAHGR